MIGKAGKTLDYFIFTKVIFVLKLRKWKKG